MFVSKPSTFHGNGLFCGQCCNKNTFYNIEIEKIYKIRKKQDKYLLDFFLPLDFDENDSCINDKKVDKLINIVPHSADMKKHYAVTSSIFMYANDAAWPATSAYDYSTKCSRNNAEFVLTFENNRLRGISLLLLKDVREDEEICVSYGYDFWIHPDSLQ